MATSAGHEKGDPKADDAADHRSDNHNPAPMAPLPSLPEQELGIVDPGRRSHLLDVRHDGGFYYRRHRSTMTRTMFPVNNDGPEALAL